MKWKEKERKRKDVSIFLRYSPFFSDILRFSPEMTEKTTENDRKRPETTAGSPFGSATSRNVFLGNTPIFRAFSSIFPEIL